MPLNKDRLDNIDTNLDSDKKNLFINKILNKFRGGSKKDSGLPDNNLDRERFIFDLVPDGIIVINLAGFIVATNQAYHTLTGYSKDEVVGKHVLQVPAIQIKGTNNYWTQIKSVFKGQDIQGLEFREIRQGVYLGPGGGSGCSAAILGSGASSIGAGDIRLSG